MWCSKVLFFFYVCFVVFCTRFDPRYISMRVPRNDLGEAGYEHGFEYGVSFYVGVWSLIDEPIASFQIGLPSTWVIPDNADFCQPLVDASCMAYEWKDRAPNFYRNVFQTMEGGLGYWCSTQFGNKAPKYRINGTYSDAVIN